VLVQDRHAHAGDAGDLPDGRGLMTSISEDLAGGVQHDSTAACTLEASPGLRGERAHEP